MTDHRIFVQATLPFPIHINDHPYVVPIGDIRWELTFEKVRHEHFDERYLGDGSTVDFVRDRDGTASYSRVTGNAIVSTILPSPLRAFLIALNRLITNYRDIFECHWIRPLEADDLARVQVEVDWQGSTTIDFTKFGGVTPEITGISDDSDSNLVNRLADETDTPIWRNLELDALDAFYLGQYETAAVLAWSALESGCRVALPGLAEAKSIKVGVLADRLNIPDRARRPCRSHNEVATRAAVRPLMRVVAELVDGLGYDPGSLVVSVEGALRTRNQVVHQGIRIQKSHAKQVSDAVGFFLRRLNLRNIPPSSATKAWTAHYGRIGIELERRIESDELALVPASPRRGSFTFFKWLDIESIGRELWVREDGNLSQEQVETLILVDLDARQRQDLPYRAYLRVTEGATSSFSPGLIDPIAATVNRTVCWTEAAFRLRTLMGLDLEATAERAAVRFCDELREMDFEITSQDVRTQTLGTELAKYLACLQSSTVDSIVSASKPDQPNVIAAAISISKLFRLVRPDKLETTCEALRRLHESTMWGGVGFPWLDSIVVDCPHEQKSYGTSERDFGQPE